MALKSQRSLGYLNAAQAGVIAIGVTLMVLRAAAGVVEGTLTLGDLVMVNAFLLQMFQPLSFLGVMYRQIKESITDVERMFALLQRPREIEDAPDARDLDVIAGEVKFEQVSFAYNPDRPILHDVSFTIPAGKTVAAVGASGAGKSTLARLLFRFYDVNAGSIRIDGQDIRHVTQDSLRAAIGVVPQDTVLFNDSIYYNIAYGRPDASREEVVEAARAAHILHFIESLPQGWDTVVGERGLKLSGGEKQRVAIARTLLKNPAILILDEATSALDTKTEKAIQAELLEIARSRTSLIIAHRLSTVVEADEILVMEGGRIVERGRHPDLLAQNGVYAHMWALQQQAEDGDCLMARLLQPGVRRREVWAWAMYDFANSGYTTVVITAVFSAYFVAVGGRQRAVGDLCLDAGAVGFLRAGDADRAADRRLGRRPRRARKRCCG